MAVFVLFEGFRLFPDDPLHVDHLALLRSGRMPDSLWLPRSNRLTQEDNRLITDRTADATALQRG